MPYSRRQNVGLFLFSFTGQDWTAAASPPWCNREHHFKEARTVAAAVDPPLLAEIPANSFDIHEHHTTFQIIQTMLAHGHVDAAFHYVLSHEGSASFPLSMVGNVLHHLDPKIPELAGRRMTLLRTALEAWRQRAFDTHSHERDYFVRLIGHCWKEFPPEEALQVTRRIVARATDDPDAGTSAGYPNEIHFTSSRQHTLFLILHVLRHFDPALAQSLTPTISFPQQLAAIPMACRQCKKKPRQTRHASRPKAQPAAIMHQTKSSRTYPLWFIPLSVILGALHLSG
jgi:hypothetical protein